MTTTITGPKNGSTTYVFNDEPNDVVVAATTTGYQLVLLGNNDTGVGSSGSDSLEGGTGFDQLTGGYGADLLLAGDSAAGQRDENRLLGDAGLIKANEAGGNDSLIGGWGSVDRLIGDADELYGSGGNDSLQAYGVSSQLIGDALALQYNSQGGNDVLIGAAQADSTTLMYGDAITAYGPCRGGNDTLVSGRSNDFMYGDWEITQQADLFSQPYILDSNDPYAFSLPILNGPQPFSFTPITFDLINQDFTQSLGGAPLTPGPNDISVSLQGLSALANQYNIDYVVPDLEALSKSEDVIGLDTTVSESTGTSQFTFVIPQDGYSPAAPTGGADLFAFSTYDEGNDVIFDFDPGEGDRIWFKNGLTKEDQGKKFVILENDRDTLITYGNSSILLPYFLISESNASEIFEFGEAPGVVPLSGGEWEVQTIIL